MGILSRFEKVIGRSDQKPETQASDLEDPEQEYQDYVARHNKQFNDSMAAARAAEKQTADSTTLPNHPLSGRLNWVLQHEEQVAERQREQQR